VIGMNDFPRHVAALRDELDAAIDRVLGSGWFILGKEVEAFERELAAFLCVAHVVGVGNGLDAIELVKWRLTEHIATEPLQETLPLPRFLAALEAGMPKDAKVPIRIDEKAFGNDLPKLVGTMVKMPAFPKRMTVSTALRFGLSKVPKGVEFKIAIRPPAVVITRPHLAVYTAAYEARDVIEFLPLMVSD